ncbi:MAG: replicative DNA helicase [Alphaproteobacteria bacterium]|nr:replicative DNA helicase [Alphaproteobacteria bacterium]MBV9584470.1 replicative DNA helicase [Alphaproteobacteria bacterium]MBV9965358.1 replicative DNA helicase [Alphaproteobacteria bacterium]
MQTTVTPLREPDLATELGRSPQPPANIEAEQALLGAILVNNAAHSRVAEFLLAEHFGNAVHGRIYAAISRLIERGQIANPITLKNLFDQDGALQEIGGAQYLARLAESAVTIINAEHYGRTIHDLYLRRELITIGQDVVTEAFRHDLDDPAVGQIERAEQKLFELATAGEAEGGPRPFARALTNAITMAEAAFKRDGKTVGVATDFIDLDKKLGGLHPSDLIILAGRPSMGKTSLATNIAFNAAKNYKPARHADGRIDLTKPTEDGAVVAFFSLEMSAEQLATRILAEESGTSSDRIRRGEVRREDFDKFVAASHRLASVPLYIDDTPALSVAALRTRARRLKRQQGLGMIVIDYLQLMRPSTQNRVMENRVQEVSDITRGLKAIAKELDVPVLACSQLSRAVEQREDKRPQLADLRESGSIEQDSDVVMFIFREEYYLSRGEPTHRPEESPEKFNDRYDRWKERCESAYGVADVIIAKQRHGPIGTVKLHFEAETTKFDNFIGPEQVPSQEF